MTFRNNVRWCANQHKLKDLGEESDVFPVVGRIQISDSDRSDQDSKRMLLLHGWRGQRRVLATNEDKNVISIPISSNFKVKYDGPAKIKMLNIRVAESTRDVLKKRPGLPLPILLDSKKLSFYDDTKLDSDEFKTLEICKIYRLRYLLASDIDDEGSISVSSLIGIPEFVDANVSVAESVVGCPPVFLKALTDMYVKDTQKLTDKLHHSDEAPTELLKLMGYDNLTGKTTCNIFSGKSSVSQKRLSVSAMDLPLPDVPADQKFNTFRRFCKARQLLTHVFQKESSSESDDAGDYEETDHWRPPDFTSPRIKQEPISVRFNTDGVGNDVSIGGACDDTSGGEVYDDTEAVWPSVGSPISGRLPPTIVLPTTRAIAHPTKSTSPPALPPKTHISKLTSRPPSEVARMLASDLKDVFNKKAATQAQAQYNPGDGYVPPTNTNENNLPLLPTKKIIKKKALVPSLFKRSKSEESKLTAILEVRPSNRPRHSSATDAPIAKPPKPPPIPKKPQKSKEIQPQVVLKNRLDFPRFESEQEIEKRMLMNVIPVTSAGDIHSIPAGSGICAISDIPEDLSSLSCTDLEICLKLLNFSPHTINRFSSGFIDGKFFATMLSEDLSIFCANPEDLQRMRRFIDGWRPKL